MAGVAFAVEGDGVGFATESYAASALYATLARLSDALWRIRRAKPPPKVPTIVASAVVQASAKHNAADEKMALTIILTPMFLLNCL
jgi:hypothetical protein